MRRSDAKPAKPHWKVGNVKVEAIDVEAKGGRPTLSDSRVVRDHTCGDVFWTHSATEVLDSTKTEAILDEES